MKKFIIILSLFLMFVMPAWSNDYAGNTTTQVDGGVGVGKMAELCFEEVGVNTLFCNTKDIFETINPFPGQTGARAWIHPFFVPTDTLALDFSGVFGTNVSCVGWASVSSRGMTVDGSGIIGSRDCSILHVVACCKKQ